MRLLLLIIALCLGNLIAAQQVPPTRTLTVSTSKALGVPIFNFWPEAQCDSAGDMYFHLDTGSYNRTTVLKFSPSTGRSTVFKLPNEISDRAAFVNFSTTKSGDFRLLAEMKEGFHIFEFDSNGKMTARTRVQSPAHMAVTDFAAFDDGTVLMSGYFNNNSVTKLQGKAFAGLFNSSGALLKQLTDSMPDTDLENAAKALHDGAATIGEDGNVYFITGSKILVVAPSGYRVRTLSFQKPEDGSVSRVSVSGGLIAIVLSSIPHESVTGHARRVTRRFLLLNAITGELVGFYQPTDDLGLDVCFTHDDGFMFVRRENDNFVLKTAEWR